MNNELIDKAFFALNMKRNEQLKQETKKFTNKDKNNAIKILEDIKLKEWKIKPKIMDLLLEIAK